MFQEIIYAGHSAVLIKGPNLVVGIDPWFEGNPRCPNKLRDLQKLDLIVLTHGHADHAGDTVRLAKQYGSHIAATYELTTLLIEDGVPSKSIIPMNKGGTVQWHDISITLTHALHSNSYEASNGTRYSGEACGIVLSDGKVSVYHAGDTALFTDMTLISRRYKPQIALLPIGDRFTMGAEEAAEAAALLRCRVAIPNHYRTYELLAQSAEPFIKECALREIKAVELEPGVSYEIAGLLEG